VLSLSIESAAISRATKLILDHYAEPLSLEDLVLASGLRRFRFLRLFKRKTGLSPHEFLIQHRIKKAKESLTNQATVLETAMNTGFFDQSHFGRHFKRITGKSPAAYRRSMRNPSKKT
jgi:AraC-like DNA-binding protein